MKKFPSVKLRAGILLISFFTVFLFLFPVRPSFAENTILPGRSAIIPGTPCKDWGRTSQICTGSREYQVYECTLVTHEDDCQDIAVKLEKLENTCDSFCVPGGAGMIVWTCEDKSLERSEEEYEGQCTKPLQQLKEEYSKCQNTKTHIWKATRKETCSIKNTFCTRLVVNGDRRVDYCDVEKESQVDSQDAMDNQTSKSTEVSQKPQEQIGSGLPVMIGEWFEFASIGIAFNTIDLSQSEEHLSEEEKKELEVIKSDAKLAKEEAREQLSKTNQFRQEYEALKNAKFWVSPGDGVMYKEPGSREFKPLSESQIISNGGILQTNHLTIIRTPTALIELEPWTYNKPAIVEFQNDTLILKSGRMTIVEEKGPDGQSLRLKTPKVEINLTGTQVAVAYDGDKDKSYVLVYEGQIELKTNDGKTQTVYPDGDKPGIVVISQKLSPTKLLISGAVVVGLIIAVFWFLKTKRLPKRGNIGRKKR
ncbi:hypothetical protein HYU95_04450 [Candidatus Daviesbacteria bacterium]|nr:hypothetical protein [Candidatus Daviesbacteria bacterium]